MLRDRLVYIENLKDFTANQSYPITFLRDGYLLSEQFANKRGLTLCKTAKSLRNLIISDNGNFSRMQKIASKFESEGNELNERAIVEVSNNGKVSEHTKTQRSILMNTIAEVCYTEVRATNLPSIVKRQLSMSPDYLIGLEDLTIPVLMLCGLLNPIFKPTSKEVIKYQKQTLELYEDECLGKYGNVEELSKTIKFVVAHAFDYESAFECAKRLDQEDVEAIAVSFGGAMQSKRFIKSVFVNKREIQFTESLPEAYLLTIAIALGLSNGLKKKIPIHVLGVGSPILVALLGYIFRNSKALSIDSTSTFKDAFAGTIYGSKYAYLKMDMYKVASLAIINDRPFFSNDPYFKEFSNQFPPDWSGLRNRIYKGKNLNVNEIIDILRKRSDLTENFIPFFSKMKKGNDKMTNLLRISRTGYNYWILRNICKNIRKRYNSPKELNNWMYKQVDKYTQYASPKWSKAVETSFGLINKFSKKI